MIAVWGGRWGAGRKCRLLTANDGPVIDPEGVPFVGGFEREGVAALVAAEDPARGVWAWWIAAREVSGRDVADGSPGTSRADEGCSCLQPRRCYRLSIDVPARARSDVLTKSGG